MESIGVSLIPTGMIIPRKILTFALRTSAITLRTSASASAAEVRVVCVRVVTSTTTIGVSTVPSGGRSSPYHSNGYDAFFVSDDGYAGFTMYSVTRSYG